MMKKFMQLPDAVMRMYFELLTDLPLSEVDRLLAGHPKDAKLRLATSVIDQYHASGSGETAAARWQKEIGEGVLPSDIPIVPIKVSDLTDGSMRADAILKAANLVSSTSEARRKIQEGGAYVGEEKTRIESHDQLIPVRDGLMLWVGKKKYCQIGLQH
jgi:tyrosyl-tRNA synthetase